MAALLPRTLRRALAFVAVVLAAVVLPASAASAHADLAVSDPADGTVLDTAPDSVVLQFTEDVDVRPDGVRVLNRDAERREEGTAVAAGSRVTAPIGDLEDGTYVVAWRVVSADGHPVRGSFTFSVGKPTGIQDEVGERAFGSGDDQKYEMAAAAARFGAYLGALGAAGAVLVGGLLRRPDEPSPVTRLVGLGAGVALFCLLIQIPLQGALATGRGLGSITDKEVLRLAITDGVGWAILVSACGLLAMVIATGLPFRGPVRVVAMAGAAIAPLGFAITGHTLTMSPAAVGYAADVAHLVGAAVWFGGLLAVGAIIRRRRRAEDPFGAAEAIARFSGWAAISAGAVVVAGFALGWIEVGGWHALTTTLYGRLLMVKVGAVVLVVAAAAWNRFRLVPTVAAASLEDPPSDAPSAWRTLLRLISAEVVLIVGVLGVTGVLVNVTPAVVSAESGPVTVTAPLGDGTMDITIDPAQVGRNDVHIYLLTSSGGRETSYDEVGVQLELASADLGPFDREPVMVSPGHFQLVGTQLPLPGEWTITLAVKPDRFTEVTGSADFTVE